jgi:hypothetical protein
MPVERQTAITPEPRFEIPTVSEALYTQTREALAKEGYTFVVAVEPLSIGQLASDKAISQYFSYVNPSKHMRGIIPQQMEVAINPKKLRLKGSNSESTDTQIGMIKHEEAGLNGKLPQEVRDLVSMRMQNASVLMQADFKYQEETGEVLFTNWFGRTDDEASPDLVINVGRADPTSRLSVGAWVRGDGYGPLFAVSVVVLPRQLTV